MELLPLADKGKRTHHGDELPAGSHFQHRILIAVVVVHHVLHRAAQFQQLVFRQGYSVLSVISSQRVSYTKSADLKTLK